MQYNVPAEVDRKVTRRAFGSVQAGVCVGIAPGGAIGSLKTSIPRCELGLGKPFRACSELYCFLFVTLGFLLPHCGVKSVLLSQFSHLFCCRISSRNLLRKVPRKKWSESYLAESHRSRETGGAWRVGKGAWGWSCASLCT